MISAPIALPTLALLLAAQSAPPPAETWSTLPPYPLPPREADLAEATNYVRAEVAAGRCTAATPSPQGSTIAAPVAILVGPSGTVRQIVPRAIGCPTVEQFTVGHLQSLTRAQSFAANDLAPGWYALTVTYRW